MELEYKISEWFPEIERIDIKVIDDDGCHGTGLRSSVINLLLKQHFTLNAQDINALAIRGECISSRPLRIWLPNMKATGRNVLLAWGTEDTTSLSIVIGT